MSSAVPQYFVERVLQRQGSRGDRWLQTLDEVLAKCCRRFDLDLGIALPNLSWNLILGAVRRADAREVVLKVGIDRDDIQREAVVLSAMSERGAIDVIDFDSGLGAIVLDRAVPGTTLAGVVDDGIATTLFAEIIARFQSGPLVDLGLPSLREYFGALDRAWINLPGRFPLDELKRSQEQLQELLATSKSVVLLHGDLHHHNILRHGEHWAVIDPKGLVGDPCFEVIQYLLNHEEHGGPRLVVLDRRLGILADRLSFDRSRMCAWGTVRGMLDACWSVQDGLDDWERGVDIARRFAQIAT